jgi:hypothetical protein
MRRFIEQGAHRWLCRASNREGEIHPRRLRTMLTTSSFARPDAERICAYLEEWFRIQPGGNGQPRRTKRSLHTPEHIYMFAKRLKQPICVAGCHLSDYGIAALLAGCAQSRWESSWMHPDVDDALTLSLLNRFASKVLCAIEKQMTEHTASINTEAPERTRGFAYALRA